MKIYFCEKCGISIPLQEVVAGRATARDGKTYCAGCRPADSGGEDLKLYFCDNCRVSIPLQDVITDRAKEVGEQTLCVDCARLSESQRRVRKNRIEQDLKEKEESRYRLHFCDSCNTSIPQSHLVTGRAVLRGGRTYCERCRGRAERKKVSAVSVVGVAVALGVAFVAGFMILGAVPNLLANSGEEEGAKDRVEVLKQEILEEVRKEVKAGRDMVNEQLVELERLIEDMSKRTENLKESFAEVAELADEAESKSKEFRGNMQIRLAKADVSLREAQEKLNALAARLEEQRQIFAAGATAARADRPDPPAAATPAAPEPASPAAPSASPEVKAWIDQLSDDDAGIRFSAAVELGKTGYKGAVEPLSRVLEKDKDTFVRRAAARSLGDLDAWAAVPSLIETLGAKEYFVAITAHKALTKITGQDFGFRDGLSRTELRKVVSKARGWWDEHKADRTN